MESDRLIISPHHNRNITLTIRVSEEIDKRINDISILTNISRNELINMLIKYGLERIEIKGAEK